MPIDQPQKKTLSEICDFLRAHLSSCEHDSASGINLEFPDYKFTAQDYLKFADSALSDPTDANRINCIGHLKRAVECQSDTLLFVLGLESRRQNMNFPQKMKFIECLQLMPLRSLKHLNRVRNKVEHEYQLPEIADLSLYFDLAAGFIASIEGSLFMLANCGSIDFLSDSNDQVHFGVRSTYDEQKASVEFLLCQGSDYLIYTVDQGKWEEFMEAVGIHFLLVRYQSLVSAEFVVDCLPK